VSGPKNESGNAMSSVASPLPPPLLVLLALVASSPPLSAKDPLLPPLLPFPLLLPLPLVEPSPLEPESPRSNGDPLPDVPHPTAIAAAQVAKDAQRSQLRTNAPPRLPPSLLHQAWHQGARASNVSVGFQPEGGTSDQGDSS